MKRELGLDDMADERADDAYDLARQRELDDAADALRAHERSAMGPVPQPCHHCGHQYAGAICPLCKEERPAYAALKRRAA